MIYKAYNEEDFIREMTESGFYENHSLSIGALKAIFQYLDELSKDWKTNIELDVPNIMYSYTRYNSITEAMEYLGFPSIEALKDECTIIEYEGGIVLSSN